MYKNIIRNQRNESLPITGIRAFTDNYIWCVNNKSNAFVVDPGDAQPVIEYLKQSELNLTDILITHHHWDHTGGLDGLIKAYPQVRIYGPVNPKIHQIQFPLTQGEKVTLTNYDLTFDILETPGHTLDHIAFINDEIVFCGDTLFSGGCGRMFEGTPEVYYKSLQKLANLPANLKVYCTHEYTHANLKFALSVEPNNSALQTYYNKVVNQREKDECTLPSTIKNELEINPFLRCQSKEIVDNIKSTADKLHHKASQSTIQNSSHEVQTFADLRKLKDNF